MTTNQLLSRSLQWGGLLLLSSVLSLSSCTEDDVAKVSQSRGMSVRFEVQDVQQDVVAKSRGMVSPGAIMPDVTVSDLSSEKLRVSGSTEQDVYMINTVVEGINPMRPAKRTHGNISTNITGTFSSIGYRDVTANVSLNQAPWFYNETTQSNGELVRQTMWDWSKRFAKFFAVSPQVKSDYTMLTLSPNNHNSVPYVDFEVEADVKQQKDLMTACSGVVEYANQLVAPTTKLSFRHALTAIRFSVGSNLSWNKRITKIEIQNACSKGRYTLPSGSNVTGTWSNVRDKSKTFTLNLSSSPIPLTGKLANTIITGNGTDNYTFMMLPQSVAGVKIVVILEDINPSLPNRGSNKIEVALGSGEWKAGTTRTYKLSQKDSDWEYVITASSPAPVAYDATVTGNYGVTSYRQAPNGSRQAVAWKVIGYDNNNDGKFSMSEKPEWLTSLSATSGTGGNFAQSGTATIKAANIIDLLAERNRGLREAAPKGSAGNYYNLANQTNGGAAVQNTANCYVISAPGFYRLPLVYGNAIKNGTTNASAYTGPISGRTTLAVFKDHRGNNIITPWIEQNHRENRNVFGAKVVWADEANLVHFSYSPITRNGSETFLQFEVKKENIKSGNAVIAITKGNVVLWSWHLWFAPQSALNKIRVTNHQGVNYDFTTENLGWKYSSWNGTTFSSPRSVKVRIEQEGRNGSPSVKKYTDITITQNNYSSKVGTNTFYQWGRKDAMPGNVTVAQGSFTANIILNSSYNYSIANSIQNPDKYYTWDGRTQTASNPDAFDYYNKWSALNTTLGHNDNPVIKTVYDPCPVGFKLPASNAFTRFTTTGKNSSAPSEINARDVNNSATFLSNFGYNFYTNSSRNTTIFFPISGDRLLQFGSFYFPGYGIAGNYWMATPQSAGYGLHLDFGRESVRFESAASPRGYSVRPCSE